MSWVKSTTFSVRE